MFKLNKSQLDSIATLLGLVGGIATILTTNYMIDANLGGTISGIAFLLLGVVTNHPASQKIKYIGEK